MRLLLLSLLAAAATFGACAQAPVEVKKFKSDADVPRISIEDAKKDFDAKTAIFVDSRHSDPYKQEHITGAINIPIGSDAAEFDKLPKGKKIIVYCS